MRAKYIFVVLILSVMISLPFVACKEQKEKSFDLKRGLLEGTKLRGTDSLSEEYALFWIFPYYDMGYATSQKEIVIGSQDQQHVYGIIDSNTEGNVTVDEFVTSILEYTWSPNESYLAVHNPTSKHSRLSLYDIRHELSNDERKGNRLTVPELLPIARKKLGLSEEDVLSSGQILVKWLDTRSLKVTVRVKTQNEMKYVNMVLHISEENEITVKG